MQLLLLLLHVRIDQILHKAAVRCKDTAADGVGNTLPWTDIISACVDHELISLHYHKVSDVCIYSFFSFVLVYCKILNFRVHIIFRESSKIAKLNTVPANFYTHKLKLCPLPILKSNLHRKPKFSQILLVVNVNNNSNVVSVLQGSSPKNGVLTSVLLSLANSKY